MDISLPEIGGKLIACYIDNPDLFEEANCANLIFTKVFPNASTQIAYDIIKDSHAKGIKIDYTLIQRQLVSRGIKSKEAFTDIGIYLNSYVPNQIAKQYTEALFEEYLSSALTKKIEKSGGAIKSGAKPIDVLEELKDFIINVDSKINNVNKDQNIMDAFDKALQRIKDLRSGVIEQYGFTFGLKVLDSKTGGIGPGITVLAGSKGGGKTTTLVQVLIHNAIIKNYPVKFFSLEMKPDDIIINMWSHLKEINSFALRTGSFDDDQEKAIEATRAVFNERKDKLSIDDTGGITWQYFESSVRAWRKKNKIPLNQSMLVMLDYLQLMKNAPEEMRMSKEERIEHIMNELMRICKNENISLLLLSQFSRDVDKRGDRAKSNHKEGKKYNNGSELDIGDFRPSMGDLKGSSAIESSAVMIILLFRPDYVGLESTVINGETKDLRGLCEMNIVKNRFGLPQCVYAKFVGKYSMLKDYDEPKEGASEDAF